MKTYELSNNVSLSQNDLENVIYVVYEYISNNDNKISKELKDVGYKLECILHGVDELWTT